MAIKEDLREALADYKKFMSEMYPSINLNNWNTKNLEGFSHVVNAIDPRRVPEALERGSCPYEWHPYYRKGYMGGLPSWVDGDGWVKAKEGPGSAYSVVLWWSYNNMRNHE